MNSSGRARPHAVKRLPGPYEFSSESGERARLDSLEGLRLKANLAIDAASRASLGQYFTPAPLAAKMASMFMENTRRVHVLDAGAGAGILFGAVVHELLSRAHKPASIQVTAYEIDSRVAAYTRRALDLCEEWCSSASIPFKGSVIESDFIEDAVSSISSHLFGSSRIEPATIAIMNPPYRKIRSDSRERKLLRLAGIEETNFYTAFLSLALALLADRGELVAITPRSFCNGTYFRAFRERLTRTATLRRLHVFEARDTAFAADRVLQETMIVSAIKMFGEKSRRSVLISSSHGADDAGEVARPVPYNQVLKPHDPNLFISIPSDNLGSRAASILDSLPCSLSDLGLTVSTGKVVEFRAVSHLVERPEAGAAPLVTPRHMASGSVVWPRPRQGKPEAMLVNPASRKWLIRDGIYPLVKRLTAKEEKRRVVAAVYDRDGADSAWLALENHLNYFHCDGAGLDRALAYGLAAFLNSTLVDMSVRQFNGHTQVNATDLRALRYPDRAQLQAIGQRVIAEHIHTQDETDQLIQEVIGAVDDVSSPDPIAARARIEEARALLKNLGLPGPQRNERSALTLLALLNLPPDMSWTDATNPLRGVTQMMAFFSRSYGKTYAPNTRETVRRQTLHQFLDMGLVRLNPDNIHRPINSGQTVYQVADEVVALIRQYGGPKWEQALAELRRLLPDLIQRFADERFIARIPLRLAEGETMTISPGGQNTLIEKIVHEFAERFIPAGRLLYIGDAENKFAYIDREGLASLGVTLDIHGKAPDVIIYNESDGWLGLIEAVTSHGPIGPKRKADLERIFAGRSLPLIFVTAFSDRGGMVKHLSQIAWETEVWIADAPDHLIHFDGLQRISPYGRTPDETNSQKEE